ncbi:MAG: hypothetical protein JNK82_35770, partial [Myxococcaceae bacterium]|nr:hypothetical protein [Myxococcaceae bacterium]
MTCPAGDPGCVCRSGAVCTDRASTCTNGFCVAGNCTPGQRNCACLAGGCAQGSYCLEGAVCVDSKGYEGGLCLDNGRCVRGNRCDTATGTCVHCEPGGAGCACGANNACSAGLVCNAGLCLGASQLPPANPKCYTPCSGNVRTDAGLLVCGVDHLVPGCLDGRTCTNGSCLAPGESPRRCVEDLDCPDGYQVCLQGGCYSNCEVNADCASGYGCFRHACRPSCVVGSGQAACAAGSACTTEDGQQGYCAPVGHSTGPSSALPSGGLSIPVPHLDLSNVRPSGSFMLVPVSDIGQEVTIRKLWHAGTRSNGASERVEAPRDGSGQYRECSAAANECPMSWLTLTPPVLNATAQQTPTVTFRLEPGCVDPAANPDSNAPACPKVTVGGAGNINLVRWEGELEITTRDTKTRVTLSYVQRPDGQWSGSMFYFGTFDNKNLDSWVASPNKALPGTVNNALIQLWGALRMGQLDGWQEFLAVLTSTREGSWAFDNVKQRCLTTAGATAACYPYSNSTGVRTYVQNAAQSPIPTGVTELPLAMNLQVNTTTPGLFEGRVDSPQSLHYPGYPGVKLMFEADPSQNASCFMSGGGGDGGTPGDCLVFLKDISVVAGDVNRLSSTIGGRYLSTDGGCGPGYAPVNVPWLIEGFTVGTVSSTSGRARIECRDSEQPFDVAASPSNKLLDQALAGGNPVPDGRPRRRTLRFLDGALVNQSELFVLFEERYDSFVGDPDAGAAPAVAYGYIRLKRNPAALTPADFVGTAGPSQTVKTLPISPGAQCDPQLLADLGLTGADSNTKLAGLFGSASLGYTPLSPTNQGVHYYCEDTGLFNGGQLDDGSPSASRQACPAGSKVLYFNVCPAAGACTKTPAELANEQCQRQYTPDPSNTTCSSDGDCRSGHCGGGQCMRATCGDTLRRWKANGTQVVLEGGADDQPLLYQCTNGTPYCDANRLDLRAEKVFLRKTGNTRPVSALPVLIENAFRYKTRFRSSMSGSTVGFAPVQCSHSSDALPYCYDPAQIEEARRRTDCLVNLYSDPLAFAALSTSNKAVLNTFLQQSFSQVGPGRDGFERLNAELLIMLGDDALTAAYTSRFDLAAAGGANFLGSQFEKGGIDLTGVAGAEMYNLYQAVEYYQVALDRMYQLGPDMKVALDRGVSQGSDSSFVTPSTVTSWLERLVRAASQKSRAYAEIARRYQSFNKPELSRAVIERAYVATYLESALLSRLMLDITERAAQTAVPQLRITLDTAQRNYRLALLDMRDVYHQISNDVNYFGYAADYIPFPALDSSSLTSGNAYEVVSLLAKQRLDLAKLREQIALSFGKQGKVDAAQFQSELTSIKNNYENQLADICGTFIASDGRTYPAIKKYAPLSDQTTLLADPCGSTGNGQLFAAMVNIRTAKLTMQAKLVEQQNELRDIDIERRRAAAQCRLATELAEFQYTTANTVADMQQSIEKERAQMTYASSVVNAATSAVMAAANCSPPQAGTTVSPGNCVQVGVAAAATSAVQVATAAATYGVELDISQQQRDIASVQAGTFTFIGQNQCAVTMADSAAIIERRFNDVLKTTLEGMETANGVVLAAAELQRLRNLAQRLQAQQEESEQLAIDVAAAQND